LATNTVTQTPPSIPAAKTSPRWWRYTRRTLLVLVTLVVAIILCGAAYQFFATISDAQRFPQQGRSVPLGPEFKNVRLNLDCSGSGTGPTVILDSGGGVPAFGWKFVQADVAKFAHVCSYDRAGYGWSSPGPKPRTSMQVVKELHALLAAAGEKPPYVLVGHSLGGYNIRVYAGQYPAEVAAMVLVDASHEDQLQRMPPALQAFSQKQLEQLKWQRPLAPFLVYSGIARLLVGNDTSSQLPADFLREVHYLQLQPKAFDAAFSELQSFSESAKQVRAAGNLGERPLVVLTAGKDPDPKLLPKGFPIKDFNDFHEIWVKDLQVRESQLSTRGKQIIVPDSTHMIPFERPDTVTAAIREVSQSAQ
jgi:pimeloyl-ACP methyl ester carboxylesterase